MSERDYAAEDQALDDELRKLYLQEPESNDESEATEAPADAGTASSEEPEQESNEDLQESTSTVDEITQEQTEEPKKAVVDEDRYKNAVRAMNRAQEELAHYRKQDAARDQLVQQLQAQVQQLQEKQTSKEAESTPPETGDDEDLKEALDLYPEAVTPLLKRNASLEKKIANLEKKLAEVDDSVGNVKTVADRFTQNEQQTAEDKYWNTIRAQHQDVDDLINDPAYLDWYPNQSPMIQQALQLKGTAKDVISALNLFRAEYPKASVPETEVERVVTKPAANKPDRLAEARAASSPTIKSGQKPETKPKYTQAQIEKMTREEFMKHETAIDEAMARGEIY